MSKFIDVHNSMKGIDQKQLDDAGHMHAEGVKFLHAWADPSSGKVFCLTEASDKDAVARAHEKAGASPDEIYEISLEVG